MTIALDILALILLVAFYAVGHYQGRQDTIAAIKRSGMTSPRPGSVSWRWQVAAAAALFLLALKWAGVFS